MKKILPFTLALALASALLPLGGCAEKAGATELNVFAAASLTETLGAVAEQYKTIAPEVTLRFNFDSSGALQTQIEEGADCDLFLSAAPRQMDALESGGLINDGTRVDLLENKVVLAVPEGNPKRIQSFEDLVSALRGGNILLATGSAGVPVGQYTRRIFEHYGLAEDELAAKGVLAYGSNVKEVTAQVREAAADCGIVYQTDAYSADLTVADTASAELCGQVVYPAAVVKNAAHAAEAVAFLVYLRGPEAAAVFEAAGFTSLTK